MRTIRLRDTLRGSVVPLEPREPGRVGIYACGPTVYGRVHVGNARPFVVFSLLKRFLEHEGYETRFVANITDVNDKIYDAARERGVASAELAARDDGRLRRGHGRARPRPARRRAARHRDDRPDRRADRGRSSSRATPTRRGGDVYFRVASFDGYGKLSNRPLEEMQQGEGDDAAELKESPQDFALWKARKEGEDTCWPSPWGEGRPGWHIECSAMAEEILGVDFEVHGGGSDLVFPHHENEIAQTEAARGKPLARVWMHNGMVEMGDEKMAKSVGNIRLLHGALEQFGRDAFVMWIVGAHYRKPVAYSEEALADAAPRRSSGCASSAAGSTPRPSAAGMDEYAERFFDALADDFNTPQARAVLFDWVTEAQPAHRRGRAARARAAARRCCTSLGLESLLERRRGGAPAELRRLADGARGGARRARLRARRRACATSWPRRAGRSATRRTAPGSCRSARRDRLRAQPGAGGDPRQAPRAARLRDRARGARGAARRGRDSRIVAVDEVEERAGSPDHQGICAEVEAYPYADADALLDAEDALVVALDEVQDPHNLGAVCRVAESAGCAGVVLPERRSAEVTPAVCKASAGAVEHLRRRARAQPGRLARRARRSARPGSTAPPPTPRVPYHRPDYRGPCGARARLRGAGPAPARGRRVRRADPPAALAAASARSTCRPPRAALVYGILHFRKGLDRAP